MQPYLIPKDDVIYEEVIKKSRFITYIFHINSIDRAKNIVKNIKKEHYNARHHCWAFIVSSPENYQSFGFSDDGEPSGTAGKPMLSQIQGSKIGEILAVTVRYYGGILLGTGGLVRAYSNGVKEALKILPTTLKIPQILFKITYSYDQNNLILLLINSYDAEIIKNTYTENIESIISVDSRKYENLSKEIHDKSCGKIKNWQVIKNMEDQSSM